MKRSIFVGIVTALALIVLTAGLAYANSRWDNHPGPGPALTSQAGGGSVQPTGSATDRAWCDQDAVHQRTATRDNDCPARADDHPYGDRHRAQATGSTPTTSPRPASHPRHDRDDHHGELGGGHERYDR
jgi:hypothetical protein